VKQNLKSDEKNQGGKYSKLKLEEVRNLADSGALRKAFSLCEEYISKNRVDAEVYFLMGLICQAEDSIYSAEDYYLKSVYLNPGNYEALVHLSLLYEQMGDIEKGSHYKERAERQHRIKKNPEPIKNTVQSEK